MVAYLSGLWAGGLPQTGDMLIPRMQHQLYKPRQTKTKKVMKTSMEAVKLKVYMWAQSILPACHVRKISTCAVDHINVSSDQA